MEVKKHTVIVAEDDPIIAWQIKKLLIPWSNLEQLYFDNAEAATIQLNLQCPNLIITNLKLAHGWINPDFLQVLRQCDCQVIIMTGLCDIRLQPDLSVLVSPNFLYKPFNSVQFRECIASLLV
ncbi:MAG: hypothetical protein HKN76_03695 [Saprospiraceae bacterium]|nr:hypothetical protein [Saprospiraceae bacterium]